MKPKHKCKLCKSPVQKRGELCGQCQKIIKLGKEFFEIGIELRRHQDRVSDMDGLTRFVLNFEPLLKLQNLKVATPKAVAIGNTWFARIDSNHPLHSCFESEWSELA